MATTGRAETQALKSNLQAQLDRLLTQMEDLEELRDEIDADEYEELRDDTAAQLMELQFQLQRLIRGDMTLVTALGAMREATAAAISQAFKSSDVIRMFAAREPAALREKLAALQEQQKLNKLSADAYQAGALEILFALKKLGETLRPEESAYMAAHADALAQFESADDTVAKSAVQQVASASM